VQLLEADNSNHIFRGYNKAIFYISGSEGLFLVAAYILIHLFPGGKAAGA
jgi:hypothetical protein